MLLLIREVTIDGDSFGFSKGAENARTNRAVRTFKLQVDGDPATYIQDCLLALPKYKDPHPSYPYCYVSDVDCTANTSDPHWYDARVTYETTDVDDDGIGTEEPEQPPDDPDGPKYPWLEKATISVSTDSANMEVNDLAYAYYGTKTLGGAFDDSGVIQPDMTKALVFTSPQVQIVNTLSERPENLPEEPNPALKFNIDFAVEGQGFASINELLQNAYTVNDSYVKILDFGLPTYTAYLEGVNCTKEIYSFTSTNDEGIETTTEYPYWKVSLTIAARKDTWVKLMVNQSYNRWYSDTPNTQAGPEAGSGYISPITVYDGSTGTSEPVKEPIRLDAKSVPIDVTFAGNPVLPRPPQTATVVNMYLTKRPADWSGMFASIPFA